MLVIKIRKLFKNQNIELLCKKNTSKKYGVIYNSINRLLIVIIKYLIIYEKSFRTDNID